MRDRLDHACRVALLRCYLPLQQCIGLACLIVDEKPDELEDNILVSQNENSTQQGHDHHSHLQETKHSLVRFIGAERRSNQLRSLAHCIGFSTEPNSSGEKGDLSPFSECLRLHVISHNLVKQRLEVCHECVFVSEPSTDCGRASQLCLPMNVFATRTADRSTRKRFGRITLVGTVKTRLNFSHHKGRPIKCIPIAYLRGSAGSYESLP